MAKTESKKENSEAAKEVEATKPTEEEKPEEKEIEKLKFSVEKLSEELNTAVAELKRSIIDIRSAVSEIENPFNLLRVITSEKDLERIKGERLPPGVKSIFIGKPAEKPEEKTVEEAEKKEEEKTPMRVLEPAEVPKVKVLEEKKPETVPKAELLEETRPKVGHLPRGTAYLNWVWSLLDAGFTPEDIRRLSQSYEELGFLPEGCSGQIYSLAVAAEKAKSRGLTKSKLLLNMYKASIISGIGIGPEDVKRLIAMAEKRSVREKASRRAE